jgi:hypothetical protein
MDGEPSPPLLDTLLREPGTADERLSAVPPVRLGEEAGEAAASIEHLLTGEACGRWGRRSETAGAAG